MQKRFDRYKDQINSSRNIQALSDKLSVTWIDPVLHPAALTKAGVEKDTIVISCKDTGKTKSLSFR